MARTKGTYSLPANVEVLAGAPLDARDRVATKADLTTSGTFPYPYVGMETFVVSEGKKYRLIGENPTVLDNWEELGSGILEGAKTVTGNPITLADGSDSYAEDLSVTIEPVQDLHGYDHPWVGGTGKNKLHVTMDSSTIGTFSMVVNSDGSVTFDGTAQSEIQNILADEYPTSNITIPSGTYKLNGGIAGVTILVYADNALIYMGSATSDTEFTIPSGISSSYVSIDIASGSIFSNVTMYPMVRLSTVTDGTFEPWANVCPITGYTECEVEDVGKNKAYLEQGSLNALTGEETTNAARVRTNFVKAAAGETLTWSSQGDALKVRQSVYYDKNLNYVQHYDAFTSNTYAVPSNPDIAYARLVYSKSDTSASVTPTEYWYQLESGSTATPYEPYHTSNVTIQFGKTVYGGRSNFTDGGTTDDRAYGTVTITSIYDASNTNVDFAVFSVSDAWAQVGYLPKEFISNMAILSDQTFGTETKVGRVHVYSTNNKQLAVSVPKGSTLSDAQTLFSGMTYCYKKAIPTTIDTPPTDLKLLKGTNNLTSNGTTINLKYWPDTVLGDVLAASEAYTDRNKGEGGGAGAVKGYYKTADGKFYEESTYTTEITPDASLLYLDLSTEKLYDCDGTNYTLVTTDEKVTGQAENPSTGKFYYIPFLNETIANQKPYYNNGIKFGTSEGTTTAKGNGHLLLGNSTPSGTAGNKYGQFRIYSEKQGYVDLLATANATSGRLIYFPDKAGTIALTSDLSSYLPLIGGTLTGRVTTAKPFNQILTGTGTAGSESSGTYYPAKWTFNTGLTPTNGDIITIKIPVAGYAKGEYLSINNGTTYHPVAIYGTSRLNTQFAVDMYITLVFDANASITAYNINGSTSSSTVTGGAWRVINYYDTGNDNTVPSAYCTTAAGTAAKTATCTSYKLLSNSYLQVLIASDNTAASALTLNINSRGAKPIYINGSVSSSSNYTLPAGTYIAFYDGTNYYFRTDGKLHTKGVYSTGDFILTAGNSGARMTFDSTTNSVNFVFT